MSGRKCNECNGEGKWEIRGCPRAAAGNDATELLRAAELAECGLWPESGGAMEQVPSALDAILYAKAQLELARLRITHGR